MSAVETKKLPKIKFQERIAIHNQEFGRLQQKPLRKFQRPGSSKRTKFSRILNLDVPFPAVPELLFNLLGPVSGAQHQAVDSLRPELQNQQLEEWPAAYRSQRFGSGWQQRLQARPQPAD